MTQIYELIDLDELEAEIREGNVRIQTHPEFPELKIANYTDQCAFTRHWTPLTRLTRGLIWNDETGEVLARPFPKFFNWDEKEAPRILDDQVVYSFSDKYDGSLGILYVQPNGTPAIATRGSFASEQAKLGTKLLHDSGLAYQHAEVIDSGFTPLYEICGPDNRIVLAYEENFLARLGLMSIADGYFVPIGGQKRAYMHELLMDLSRPNAEGWVVWKTAFEAVKIKQADYIELHRLVSNLSEKEVWRQLRAGTYDRYVKELPDELYQLAEGWANALRYLFTETYQNAQVYTNGARTNETRKDQALWIKRSIHNSSYHGLVFGLLDGKDISDSIWRLLEPKGASSE